MKPSPTMDAARHQCFIYDGAPSVHLPHIAQSLIEQLGAKRRCLYLNSPPMVVGMRWHLTSAGLDLADHLKRGALTLSSDQGHLAAGKFDVGRMLGLLRQSLAQALADGYEGLWASGDMTWEFGSETNFDKLADYERRLDDFIRDNPGLGGVCLYHRATLPPHAVETALATHPSFYRSAIQSDPNPRYYRLLSGTA